MNLCPKRGRSWRGLWRGPAEHPKSIDFVYRQQASVTHKQRIYVLTPRGSRRLSGHSTNKLSFVRRIEATRSRVGRQVVGNDHSENEGALCFQTSFFSKARTRPVRMVFGRRTARGAERLNSLRPGPMLQGSLPAP